MLSQSKTAARLCQCLGIALTLSSAVAWAKPVNSLTVESELASYEVVLSNLPPSIDPSATGVGEEIVVSRVGPKLLSTIETAFPEIKQVDYGQSKVLVPDWFARFQEEHSVLADSVALAVAEQFYLREKYLGTIAWLDCIEGGEVYSPALRVYLIATSNYLLVEYDKASEVLKGVEVDSNEVLQSLGRSRQQTLVQLARILESKKKELTEISQRMFDIERRLALGQTELPTTDQQQHVIDDLDKIIKKLEQQLQQQQQQGSAGGSPGGTPAQDSRPAEGKGPGDVDRKRFATGDPWGQLSPAERERLSQSIDRDFPSHYRNLIESYYQRLAEGEGNYQETPGGQP